MKKQTHKNYLKIGILTLGLSLLFTNCEKEDSQTLLENNLSTSEQIQNLFNQIDYSALIPYDYIVDWSNPIKLYSDELEKSYYEFPINYTSLLNPTELNKLKQKKGYYTKYKILAVESNEDEFNFYATKFYQNVNPLNEDLINSDVTFSNVSNYSGIIHLIDKAKNIVYTKKIDNGKVTQYSPFKTKKKSTSSLTSKNEENCETVRITYYTEWYKVYTDENGKKHIEYTHRQITGYDFEENCVSDGGGFPEMDDYAPNGAGVYKKTGNKYVEEEIAFIDDEINNCPGEQFPNANGDCVEVEEIKFDENLVFYEEGVKPIYEFDNKCGGIQKIWSLSQSSGNEFAAVLTTDGAILITQQLNSNGGGMSGIYEHNGKTYYQYPISLGAPSRDYSGQLQSAGRYFIPIKATIHSHTPCLNDGTDGITNNNIDDDQNFASNYSGVNHFILGCEAIGQFNGNSNNAFNIQNGNLNTLCNNIN